MPIQGVGSAPAIVIAGIVIATSTGRDTATDGALLFLSRFWWLHQYTVAAILTYDIASTAIALIANMTTATTLDVAAVGANVAHVITS